MGSHAADSFGSGLFPAAQRRRLSLFSAQRRPHARVRLSPACEWGRLFPGFRCSDGGCCDPGCTRLYENTRVRALGVSTCEGSAGLLGKCLWKQSEGAGA